MTLTGAFIIWGVCSLIVLIVLGLESALRTQIGGLPSKFQRHTRVILVSFGPITLAIGLLMLIPPTRYLLYAAYAVLIKK